ncbi:MAG: hypothetical protein JNM93_04200 [Bacteriovoracaceae bacterium]|nr:hypothetical protein [Bacteriovoracaceae bacterium]
MTNNKKVALYYGNDDEFFEIMQRFYKTIDPKAFSVHKHSFDNNFYSAIVKEHPHLVVFDFVNFKHDLGHFAQALNFLRKNRELRSIPFVALFKSKEELEQNLFLLDSGIVYTFIKGLDVDIFLTDVFFMAFEDPIRFRQFATAPGIDCEANIQVLSSIVSVNADKLSIDTDIEFEDDALTIQSNLFEGFYLKNINSYFLNQNARVYDHIFNIDFLLPYPGPWDTPTEEHLRRDTVETWIENFKPQFNPKVGSICIVDHRLDSTEKIIELNSKVPCHVNFISEFTDNHNIVVMDRPSIIFYQTGYEEHGKKNTPQDLKIIIDQIKHMGDYEPIILMFNNPSKSEAVRQAFGYQHMLSDAQSIEHSLIPEFLKIHEAKRTEQNKAANEYKFQIQDNHRLVEIDYKVKISSLSEHVVTFYSKRKIPLYVVLVFNFPIRFFVSIIPPIYEIHNSPYGNQYMGFIHGLDDKDLSILRKFVNKLIPSPHDVFQQFLDTKNNKTEDIVENADDVTSADKAVADNEAAEQPSIPQRTMVVRKNPYKGKSKL